MTGSLPAQARLAVVAGWDVPPVRAAVVTLVSVAERLTVWRARLAEVALALESAQCWSGPAARSAAQAVYDLYTVATAVDRALSESRDSLERLAGEADAAQERASEAMSLARDQVLPDATIPGPGAAVVAAEAALAHADAVAAAADSAGSALSRLGVRDAFAPVSFADLAARLDVVGPVAPPGAPGGGATEVTTWWSGLSPGAQLVALRTAPGAIGALDGVPAWARDRANRLLLDRARRHPGTPTAGRTARAVAERIAIEEAAGRPVQLHLLDLEAEQVVLVLGDLDTADAVGLLVPGINNSPDDDLSGLVGDARDVAAATRAVAPGLEVATVVWLGYASPDTPREIVTRAAAREGGPVLAATLEGTAAARTANGTTLPRTTVLAHSYGTVVVDEAADAPGRLAADAVVLLGSPGMEPPGAEGLEAPEVYDAASPADPISWLPHFGRPPWLPGYGSTGLPGHPLMTHSDYYDPAFPTLAAIGEVVAGDHPPG